MRSKKKINNLFLKTYLFGVMFSFLLLPIFAYAATQYTQDLSGLFQYAKDIIEDLVLWLITTGAVLFFIFRIVIFIYQGANNPAERKKQLAYIGFSLIALTLMFTFYAVTGLLASTFGIQIGIPQFFTGNPAGSTSGQFNDTASFIAPH